MHFGRSLLNAIGDIRLFHLEIRRPWLRFVAECALGILGVGMLTVCGLGLHWNLSTASLMYLLLVVLCAHQSGFWEASVISVAAVVMQSYCFAPPAFSFYIADPQNGIAIFVFEITALLVSRVSTRERSHARQLERKQASLNQLYSVSRGALLLNPHDSPVRQMAELILRECKADAVAILHAANAEFYAAGEWPYSPAAIAESCVSEESSTPSTAVEPGLSCRRILVSSRPIGVLLVRGQSIGPLTMDALASLIALALDRHRAFHSERAAEAAHQTEQLRTTVLDGLAHAFKTPLTIIRAASSGLLEMGHLDYMQQELTTIIDSESMKLNLLATRLLQTARLEGERIALARELVSFSSLIREVTASVTRDWAERDGDGSESPRVQIFLESRRPEDQGTEDRLTAMADYDMLAATVRELLENAAKYSVSGSPISIRACESNSEIQVSVHNRGPVISLQDRERIFERYYRCPDHRYSAPGTGIGLAMARNTLKAHGGHIWVISGEREGTTFTFSLPRCVPCPTPIESSAALPATRQSPRTHELEAR